MSSLSHHGIKGQKWGVRRFQNADGTLTAAGRKRKQHLIEVGSGKRKRLVEAAKPIGTSGDYSRDVTGLNRRVIHGRVINKDDNTHVIKKGTSLYRTAANPELNDDGTYSSLTKNDVDRYIDYGRSGELPGADKSNLNSMKIFEFSANRDLKIANGKYITEIITDDVKRRVKNGDADQVKLGKEILESFKRYEENLNLSFSTSEMRRSKEAASRTEKEKEFDRDLVGKASDQLALYDKTILDYSSGKDYRVIRDRLKREGYDGFIDVEDVTTIENLVRGGANAEYPVVILNANDVLTLKRSIKESETQRRLKRGTKFNSSRGELDDVLQHSSLSHHGIKGQKWGVRRFQNKDGTLTREGQIRFAKKNLKHAKVRNLDKWGKSPDSNVLYIIGTSGSGKSTTAKGLAEDGDQVIHLDTIFEKENHGSPDSNKDFEAFLKANNVDITKASDFSIPKEERWKTYDAIGDLVEAYGQHCFTKGSKVVIEGVQMGDQTLYPDKNYFNGKPTVVLKGNIVRDTFRADRRDGVPLRKTVVRLTDKERWNWYKQVNATSNEIKYTSIGGTMYIEGNALILGDSSYLEHHGIRGQRWGVRRFQNKDGTRTAAGKKRDEKLTAKANEIRRKQIAAFDKKIAKAKTDSEREYYKSVKKFVKKRSRDDLLNDAKKATAVAIGQGVATAFAMRMTQIPIAPSIATGALIAKTMASENLISLSRNSSRDFVNREFSRLANDNLRRDMEFTTQLSIDQSIASMNAATNLNLQATNMMMFHTSIGGTMYIEGNALILGDSSYLEHHGIRGQKWGVRRFQNRDGSLTNAGRKRLGYATKGAAQTVGKAFKAGVKAGGNAVKAVKAHHEKKEAEKLEKKKEKASKTRLGVMANKDLFTNEEIRKLNERFKLEDEMKMATLQKGVEIAKAVGTIAQNVGTVAKTYEDVTGQSLSPIKRKAAEEKARQDKEDRERRIAREDADEARKAAKEERDIAIHEQTLRKAIASADTQEFTAQKTKAEADSSILDFYKKGQDFNGGTDTNGQSWMEKAKNGGKNPFDDMIANRDPEYAQIRKEHDEKVARKERMAELDRREKERQAEKEAASKQSAPQQKQGGGDDDALFSQKGSLPIDKDRYRNNRAMEKAKQVKEDAAEERVKKQDEKAVNRTIDDTIEANRSFKETVRAQDPHAYDRGVAKDYIKGKLNNLPNALADLNPVNRAAKRIADKAAKEEEAQVRKSMKDQYDRMVKSDGRDEANYVMYETRVANLQQQGYSERKARQIADSDPTFSAKRNRKKEYYEKVGEIEATHRNNSKELNKANKELTDYYYKLINGPGYDPGTPKREELDRKYRQKRGELERLEKDNNEMLDREKKKAKQILEHSFSIQNGVLFIDSSDGLAHHGIKGQRWGVRRFQNPDGSLTEKGRKHYEKALAREKRKQASSDAIRGTLERQHPFAVTGAAILGAVAAGMSIAATGGASVAMIAAGSAISAAVSSGLTHASYSASEAWEGRGTRMRSKKIAKYENMLKQSDMEEGMYHVENGTLFINAGEPYLEHHGVLGMKWGKHLMAGKGVDAEGGGGGGFAEDDEKLKEMAKKAGMSVAEYRKKFSKEISRMNQDASERKEGSHWALAKADVYGKTENHMPLLENKHKDKNAKEAMQNNARLAETKYKAQQAAQEYTRNHTNSQKDINKWRNAAYLDSSNYLHKELAEARTEKAQQYYKNSVGGKIDRAKQKAGSALRGAKAALKEGPSGVGDRIYDAAGGKYKKRAASNTKAAREDVQKEQLANRMANQQRAREASEVRKKGGRASRDKGFNTVNGHDVIAEGYRIARKKHQEAASEANAKYENSLAGKYDKMKADRARKKSARQEKAFSGTSPKEKKRLKDVAGELYGSKHRKDFERNARLLEGSTRSAVEIGRDTYKRHGPTSGFGDPTYKATDDAYKRANKQWNKARVSGQKYDRSIAKRVDSLARKASKARKRRAKHLDDTNAIYTEGTRLVVNSKWG